MSYIVTPTKKYLKDYEKYTQTFPKARRAEIRAQIKDLFDKIANGSLTPTESCFYHIHGLTGDKEGIMELHFQGDICIEYEVTSTEIRLLRIGTHSALCLGSVQTANPINVNAYYRLGIEF